MSDGVEKMLGWLDHHWMFLAPPVALTLVVYKFILCKPKQFHDKRVQDLILWGYLALPIYSFHQLEEHGFDLFGRSYHFIEYFNAVKPLGIEMTPRAITIINLVQVHCCFGLYALQAERSGDPLTAVLSHALAASNAFLAHILPALLKFQYNPGLLQSLFMGPLSATVVYKFYAFHGHSLKVPLICILFGTFYGHFVTLLVPLKLLDMGVFNEIAFIVWSLSLLLVFPIVASKVIAPGANAKGE